jgi:hypothetical protein
MSGGLPAAKYEEGLRASPGQTLVIGRRSATFLVERSGRRRFGYP